MANSELSAILQSLQNKQFREAEQQAAALLKRQPRLAQAWVYLGEALLRQGCGRSARAVFERASLLDPQAAWTDSVHAALQHVPDGPVRAEVDQLLWVKPVTVAAAIMTQNEERCIERCIRSLLDVDAVDEILVIDSTSTDRTLELATQFPEVRLLRDIPLHDNFAGKRNAGLPHLVSDWVLWIDADEWLEPADRYVIRQAAGIFDELEEPAVLNICQLNRIGARIQPEFSLPRMFPLRRGLRYYGRVHEQVVQEGRSMFDSDLHRSAVRIRLHHDGYEPEAMRQGAKLDRNLRLLRLMVAEEPDHPGWLLYCARETLVGGNQEEALRLLLLAEEKAALEPRFGRLSEVHRMLANLYVALGELGLALEVCERSLRMQPDFPDMLYLAAQIRMRQAVALLQQSERELRAAKEGFQTYRGVVAADRQILDWKADATLGDLARLTGRQTGAKAIYQAILERHPELEAVKKKLERLERLE